ncbi:Release factor glutamine methyltransferase (RF MTase) (N5-glutamine methyltransferase PrmC) (Protein-(glutamine-N5) MTase PrmC) (Protein-glutamine N-methyltransferase PrmC) [Durusdinium trenchii]|uniref:Release factor glutamine methyltransferase (RF MTase) (N5-glutamine methyltransferase PrmC) (Protein-(Glutamine-N5) MTase PrmC) (Protein-glutamine N-methyltransferase PrmC) n=1 Tax=Durusdinium trenchii TaxID=1381693 RepID=A0ABP0K358_9DINO
MRRSMRLLDLVHLKLGLSLMESRRAIQEGRVQVDATIIADIARFMDLDSTLTLLPRPQGVQTSELRIEHLELEFMVVWKPADMTVKELCFKERQIQILECICFCPVPGTKLLTAILAELGYGLLGRNACSKAVGKKPLKCLIAWNFVDRQLEVRAPIPIAFTKTFDSQQEAWRRHWRVFRSLSNSAHVERFCGHGFLCDGVMIPRLGTEVIAEEAARQLSLATSSSPSLLDVGTGSGCIAIAALLGLPEDSKAFAVGLDKSATAVQIAQTNGRLLLPPQKTFIGLQLCFSQLQELATSADGFDVIVSNPPYLTRRQAQELGYATPVGPGEGRGRGTVEPIESFVLQRSAQVVAAVAACEERPGSLDGSVAVYGLLRAAIVKRRAKCPLLKQHGALVLEVPPSLERRVCSLFSNEVKPARGTDCASIASRAWDWSKWSLKPSGCFQGICELLNHQFGISSSLKEPVDRPSSATFILERRLYDASGLFRGFVFRMQ